MINFKDIHTQWPKGQNLNVIILLIDNCLCLGETAGLFCDPFWWIRDREAQEWKVTLIWFQRV